MFVTRSCIAGLVLGSLLACRPPGAEASAPGDADAGAREPANEPAGGADVDDVLDPDDPRAVLYAELRDETERREAFSPVKEERLGIDVLAEMDAAASDLADAESDTDLYYALVKIGAARRDRHLAVEPAEGGLVVPGLDEELEAPIRFAADYGTPDATGIYVTDADSAYFADAAPAPGDRVVAVNGVPLAEHVARVAVYYNWSTPENLWWNVADDLHERNGLLPPDHFRDDVTYTLLGADGATYDVTAPYLPDGEVRLPDAEPTYPDLELAFSTETYDLYLHTGGREVVLLRWHGFVGSLEDDVDRLVDYAEREGLLGHALIVDATGSHGGSRGAYALQRMTGRPFRCTFGNLRLSDVVPAFVEDFRRGVSGGGMSEADARLLAWLEGPVTDAWEAGEAYSEDVPFKLAELPADSDGVLAPAPVHFTGPLVALFGPGGGSHLDQFAAMIVDNDLGYTIGMPTGGFSNTWEWTETLTMPDSDRPLVDFMWSIGQTIRPDGEVLEGNPAPVDERVPPTAENRETWHALLLERAYAWLDAGGGR